MTRFVTQLEPLISLSDHRMTHTQEHEDRERETLLHKSTTSVPLTGTGVSLFQKQETNSSIPTA